MAREKLPALIIFALILIGVYGFHQFTPKPILEDVDNIRQILIYYNPYYDSSAAERRDYDLPSDRILVVDEDCDIRSDAGGIKVSDTLHDFVTYVPDMVVVADYDEKELAECISRYKAAQTLSRANGYWLGDVELELHIFTNDGTDERHIRLGYINYCYESGLKWEIKDADKLLSELLGLIDIKQILKAHMFFDKDSEYWGLAPT